MRKMKDRDEGETARRENEEMEVKGQEEGGEGSSDLSQPSLLKCVCVCVLVYMSVCYLQCTRCVVCSCVCVLSPMYNKS